MSEYYRTSTQKDAIDSLRMVERFAKEIQDNQFAWKWLIIAYHACIQGLMVLTLEEGNGLRIMSNKNAKTWVKSRHHNLSAAEEDKIDYPSPRLDSFGNLYKKVKEHSLDGNSDYDEAIQILNDELRNHFIHFSPKGWSIEILLMHETCQTLYGLINRLARNPHGFMWYEENRPEHIPVILDNIADSLANLHTP